MIASAGMHTRDFLLRTHEPSILSHVTPTRRAHRWRRIIVPVSGHGRSEH